MRDTIRRYQFPSFDATDGIPKGSVELKFVVGRPRPSVQKGNATGHGHGHGHGEEGEQGVLRMLEQLQRENEQYGDLVVLDHMLENGDDGKTWNWFQYVANRKEPPPRFAM